MGNSLENILAMLYDTIVTRTMKPRTYKNTVPLGIFDCQEEGDSYWVTDELFLVPWNVKEDNQLSKETWKKNEGLWFLRSRARQLQRFSPKTHNLCELVKDVHRAGQSISEDMNAAWRKRLRATCGFTVPKPKNLREESRLARSRGMYVWSDQKIVETCTK